MDLWSYYHGDVHTFEYQKRKEKVMIMNIKGGTHLDLNDRIKIQSEIEKGTILKDIAVLVAADERTVSKEVKKRRIMTRNNRVFIMNNKMNTCKKTTRFPYVCNGCDKRKKCNDPYFFDYRAKEAQGNYEKILKETRQGIDMDPATLNKVDAILKDGLTKGQSITHIYEANKDDIPCSVNTLYRHIDNGTSAAIKIDLRRAVKFKPRKKKKKRSKRNLAMYEGRNLEDFIKHITANFANTFIIELDTVEDPTNGAGKTLLTIHMTMTHFMIIRLLEHKSKEEVSKQFIWLRDILGDTLYQKVFSTGLTDRGGEFFDIESYEGICADGSRLCKLFFCDSYASYQKGAIEENHTILRYILPKKTYFTDLDQDKCDLIASHINSYYRKSIDNTPIDLVMAIFFKEMTDKLNIKKIDPKDVNLTPSLIK